MANCTFRHFCSLVHCRVEPDVDVDVVAGFSDNDSIAYSFEAVVVFGIEEPGVHQTRHYTFKNLLFRAVFAANQHTDHLGLDIVPVNMPIQQIIEDRHRLTGHDTTALGTSAYMRKTILGLRLLSFDRFFTLLLLGKEKAPLIRLHLWP